MAIITELTKVQKLCDAGITIQSMFGKYIISSNKIETQYFIDGKIYTEYVEALSVAYSKYTLFQKGV